MGDASNLSLQAGYLVCANNLRREAKLCDIILYVQGRMGAMVGYPAHKLLLISASKYFKLLFEREELRSYCHFPHLSEEGVFAVLDIIYGREIRKETSLDDALMAARFLQVDTAVDVLENKKEEARAEARASPEPKRQSVSSSEQYMKKRRIAETLHNKGHPSQTMHLKSPSHQLTDAKHYKNSVKTPDRTAQLGSRGQSFGDDQQEQSWHSQDSAVSQTDHGGGGGSGYQDSSSLDHESLTPQDNMTAIVKMEPDVDLTADDSEQDGPPLGYGQQHDLTFAGQAFSGMKMDNSQTDESGMLGMGDFGGSQSFQGGQNTTGTVAGAGMGGGLCPSIYRRRTSFSPRQLALLNEEFNLSPLPQGNKLEELCMKTGLKRRVIQVWFQNMRSKHRRLVQNTEGQPTNCNYDVGDGSVQSASQSYGQYQSAFQSSQSYGQYQTWSGLDASSGHSSQPVHITVHSQPSDSSAEIGRQKMMKSENGN